MQDLRNLATQEKDKNIETVGSYEVYKFWKPVHWEENW